MECVLRLVLCGLLLVTPVANADVLAGKWSNAVASNTLMRFTDGQSGNVAPTSTFGGAASGLQSAIDMVWSESRGELFVSDFTGPSIRVYDELTGDDAPIRIITSPSMGQPRQLLVLPQHNEIIVITFLRFVATYSLEANGSVAPLRQIGVFPNPVSGLDNPSGLAYNPVTDEIYVGDSQYDGVANNNAEVRVFPRTAHGDVAPSRIITGNLTQMGTFVADLAFNQAENELYVLTNGPNQADRYSVNTFAADATGNATPLRRIQGDQTGFIIGRSMTYDAGAEQIVLATDRENSALLPGLLFFASTANGNIAPSKVIRGDQTGTSANDGWTSVTTLDWPYVFKDGFEDP